MALLQHKSYLKNKVSIQEKYSNKLKTEEKFKIKTNHSSAVRDMVKNNINKSKYVNRL